MSERNDAPLPLPTPPDGVDPKTWRTWLRERNMVQYRGLSDDEFRQVMEEKQRQRDEDAAALQISKESAALARAAKGNARVPANLFEGLDLGTVTDLASSLPPEWQREFRREVARTKAYIAKFADAEPVILLIEEYVYLGFVVRAVSVGITAGQFDKKTAETADILLRRRTEMASALELTPEAKRKRGGSTEATIASALEASQKAVAKSRPGRSDRRTQMAQVLAAKTQDAVRSLKPTEDIAANDDG